MISTNVKIKVFVVKANVSTTTVHIIVFVELDTKEIRKLGSVLTKMNAVQRLSSVYTNALILKALTNVNVHQATHHVIGIARTSMNASMTSTIVRELVRRVPILEAPSNVSNVNAQTSSSLEQR